MARASCCKDVVVGVGTDDKGEEGVDDGGDEEFTTAKRKGGNTAAAGVAVAVLVEVE